MLEKYRKRIAPYPFEWFPDGYDLNEEEDRHYFLKEIEEAKNALELLKEFLEDYEEIKREAEKKYPEMLFVVGTNEVVGGYILICWYPYEFRLSIPDRLYNAVSKKLNLLDLMEKKRLDVVVEAVIEEIEKDLKRAEHLLESEGGRV